MHTFIGLARKEASENRLNADHSQVMEIIGLIAEEDYSSGPASTKIQLAAALLARVEADAVPGVDEVLKLTRIGIKAGLFDTSIEETISLLTRRRDALAAQRVSELEVNAFIKISDTCRPKMLAGERVQVTGFDGDKVKVRLLRSYSQKWREGNIITLPRTLVGEVVS